MPRNKQFRATVKLWSKGLSVWELRAIYIFSRAEQNKGYTVSEAMKKWLPSLLSNSHHLKKAIVGKLTDPDSSGFPPLTGKQNRFWLNPQHPWTKELTRLPDNQIRTLIRLTPKIASGELDIDDSTEIVDRGDVETTQDIFGAVERAVKEFKK